MARRRAARDATKRRPPQSRERAVSGTARAIRATPAAEPEALVVTHWFDAGEGGEPYPAKLRLTGRRVGVRGVPKPGDTFTHEDGIDGIVPGSGRVSVSSWVYGLQPGEWNVSGELVRLGGEAADLRHSRRGRRVSTQRLPRAAWSWRRWAVSTIPPGPLRTRWALPAPLARIPAVVPGSWTVLGTIAIVIAVATQAVILSQETVPVGPSVVVSLLAVALGLVGAKLWYAVLHPGPWRRAILGGWAVDGFLGVALVAGVAGLLAFDLPVGAVLDATAPGLFFAVAIGRVGCFLTGCCAGRSTRSRWGIWSSDRRIGARRIPAQLLESVAGLLIGLVAAWLVFGAMPPVDGLVFAAAFAVYIVVRQVLLRLRAERREYSWRRRELVARARS